jgi:hypothetical protein
MAPAEHDRRMSIVYLCQALSQTGCFMLLCSEDAKKLLRSR